MFIKSLALLFAAEPKSPCRMLFGIVIKFDKLFKALLVPVLIGDGNFLYPFAIGLKITLSNPMFNANVALLSFSKQSLTSSSLLKAFLQLAIELIIAPEEL